MRLPIRSVLFVVVVGCGADDASTSSSSSTPSDSGPTGSSLPADSAVDSTPPSPSGDSAAPDTFVVVTINSGTTPGLPHDSDGDAYTDVEAAISDDWYGNGLAWVPAIEAATAWFATADVDLVAFQEIFDVGECPSIPADKHRGFVCEGFDAGDPTVPERVLGDAYAVQCHPGRGDKCLAVHERFGTWAGPLEGEPVPDCGSGARVARGVVIRPDGSRLTVVHVHGSSGVGAGDVACRVAQVDQVFVDLDGEPGVNGDTHVVLGDLNTDPGRMTTIDASAVRWAEEVGGASAFQWVTEVGPDAAPTYGGLFNIDHVASDGLTGTCTHETVLDTVYFDHVPARCVVGP